MPLLPGGRGKRLGADATVDSNEGYDARSQRIPAADGFVYAIAHPLAQYETATCASGYARFCLMPPVAKRYTLAKVSLSITVLAAAGILHTALYRFDDAALKFLIVPGTKINFATDVATVVTMPLSAKVTLQPDTLYFQGALSNTNTAEFAALANVTKNRPVKSYYQTGVTDLGSVVTLSGLTTTYTCSAPLLAYLSTNAAKVL